MVDPVLDGSTAPPAAVRRENDLTMVNPVLDGREIETPRAAAREMAALREEMAALREEVAALLAALTSPGSFLTLYGLHPSEAKVPRGIPSPDSSPPRGRLPSEAPVARGVPSKASCSRRTTSPDSSPPRGRLPSETNSSPPLDRAAGLIQPAFDAFTEGPRTPSPRPSCLPSPRSTPRSPGSSGASSRTYWAAPAPT